MMNWISRIAFAAAIATVFLIPSTTAWLIASEMVAERARHPVEITPPNPAPDAFAESNRGPVGVLVTSDPWFAGTIVFWLIPWGCIYVVYCVVAAVLVERPPDRALLRVRRPRVLIIGALLLGFVFALPWMYAIRQLGVNSKESFEIELSCDMGEIRSDHDELHGDDSSNGYRRATNQTAPGQSARVRRLPEPP